jgi:tetratricopeptide (TPR) repeat protein
MKKFSGVRKSGLGLLSVSSVVATVLSFPAAAADSHDHSMSTAPVAPTTLTEWARGAKLFAGLGHTHRKISTRSREAQAYFDQGMRFMWAFNHDEASRSFARGALLDAHCAMCLWGFALTVGPNYNMPMMAEARAKAANAALRRAMRLEKSLTPVERDLIEALRARYPKPEALDPGNARPVLSAYANAMRTVAHRYPEDSDVQTMFAESLMNINAWKLWSAQGKPNSETEEIVATLESVLKRDPQHPGANHYYIHAIEASPHPEKGVVAAEQLKGMMPAAGHLEHMPSHILQRVGRYEEAAEANRKGYAADRVYLQATQAPDYYPMYLLHNLQFLAYSAAMEGRKQEAFTASGQMREQFPESAMLATPGFDWMGGALPYMVMVRFAAWEPILAEPAPNPALQGLTGGYLFARTLALASTDQLAAARQTLEQLRALQALVPKDAPAGNNNLADVLNLAYTVSLASVQSAGGEHDVAITTLAAAVELEDALSYDEPSAWFFPVRHLLGAKLISLGRNADAEAVYREDLRHNPDNGWSLSGLSQALRGQGKTTEALQTDSLFEKAWQHADVKLTGPGAL